MIKRNGAVFSAERGNLTNRHSMSASGFVRPGVALYANKKGVSASTVSASKVIKKKNRIY
jgi:hypothetical protein